MNAATLCSGIGAPECAMGRVGGFRHVFTSEIEKFPCAVLARHWPDVPNRGDMTAWRDWPVDDLDLLVAGTPCQAFSVAGARAGLDDARGNLTLEFVRYANTVRPRWVLWENVPGVLSDKTNAFGCLLAGLVGSPDPLVPRGGRWTNEGIVSGPLRQCAWRILDAQFFGVAQRRRRVWVLAGDIERGAGEWRCARALFPVGNGMRGDFAQGGAAWEEVAGASGGGVAGCYWDGGQTSDTLDAVLAKGQCMPEKRRFPAVLVQDVAHTLRAEWHDASEDGTGRGVPLVVAFDPQSGGDMRGLELRHTAQLQACQVPAVHVAEHSYQFARIRSSVRRLTPREFERLQGFPDDWTRLPVKTLTTKPRTKHFAKYQDLYEKHADGVWVRTSADGSRYKALGNSMAIPCVEWILRGIMEVDG